MSHSECLHVQKSSTSTSTKWNYYRLYTICIERERDSWQSIIIHQPGFPETREIPPLDHLWGLGSTASLQFAQIDLSSPYLSLSIYIGLLSIVGLHQTSPAWETLGRQLTTLNQRRNPSKKFKESKVKTVRDSYAQQTTISPSAAVRTEVDLSSTIVALCYFHLPKNDPYKNPHCIASCCQGSTGRRVAGIDLVGWFDTAQA